jgi:hypothetical protein
MDTTTLLVTSGVIVLLAAGGCLGFLLVRRRGRRRDKARAVHHFRCPGCKRRLRFSARQVGHKGKCSNCGHDVTFPLVSQSVE